MSSSGERRPDFSDVTGGSSSTTPGQQQPQPEPAASETTYTVKPGDSLSRIARQHYGDAQMWPKIFEANRDQIKNPDLIHPGQVLTLPAR
jgi:nucleoid-associated protein YgaU